MYWVQVVRSADYKILCRIVVCHWGKAHMGNTCDFNLLMYFCGSRDASTMFTYHIFVGLPTTPKGESRGNWVGGPIFLGSRCGCGIEVVTCFLCLLTRPLSPLLSPCSCLQLLLCLPSLLFCSAAQSSCGTRTLCLLFCSDVYCWDKNACGYQRVCHKT